MVQKIVWSAEALADLKSIHDYIAHDSVVIAGSFIERMLKAIDRLADFPRLGPRIREWKSSPYRHIIVLPYRVIYRVQTESSSVYIIAIAHGSRDLKRFLRGRTKPD